VFFWKYLDDVGTNEDAKDVKQSSANNNIIIIVFVCDGVLFRQGSTIAETHCIEKEYF
jgi:hypothetical protein